MTVLFANVPFVKPDGEGGLCTGPNAGSRWPFTLKGLIDYGPFPFFMGYAVSYLRLHGIDARFFDAVVDKVWDLTLVQERITAEKPEVLFLETSTPLWPDIRTMGRWAKETLGCRVVLVGPHIQAFGEAILKEESWVDHCVIGEYEKPALDIVQRGAASPRLHRYDHLDDIDMVAGENFLPYRPMDSLYGYWDPSMNTPRIQLTVSTSRGCPFKCTYCQWPKVMNDGRYRNRRPELVLDEIAQTRAAFDAHLAAVKAELGADLATMAEMPDRILNQ
ncbi:MAG: B12-binding domain-containing radical SAM protein, partial [Rhodospirillaceae bacterium]